VIPFKRKVKAKEDLGRGLFSALKLTIQLFKKKEAFILKKSDKYYMKKFYQLVFDFRLSCLLNTIPLND